MVSVKDTTDTTAIGYVKAYDSGSMLELGVARVAYAQDVAFLLFEARHVSKPKVNGHVAFVFVRI